MRSCVPRVFLASLTLALVAGVAAGACTVKEPQTSTYFDVTIEPILQGVVRPLEHGRRLSRGGREGQRVRQPRPVELREHRPQARPAARLRAVPEPVAPREERRAVPAEPAALGRVEDRRHDGHQAHRRADPRSDRERLRHAEAMDRERRDGEQHRRPAREHREVALVRVRPHGRRLRPRQRSPDQRDRLQHVSRWSRTRSSRRRAPPATATAR